MQKKIIQPLHISTTVSDGNGQQQSTQKNPLLKEWSTPFQTPPFEQIKTEHYAPALRTAIAESEKVIEQIAHQTAVPTFENTITALELCDRTVDRIVALLLNLNECITTPEMQDIVIELMPEITRHNNRLWMDEVLFQRVKTLYDQRETLSLTAEQREVLTRYYQHFVDNGVNLEKTQKKQFAQISEELSLLTERFNQNTLADTNEYTLHISNPDNLSGLPDNVIEAAHEEATKRHLKGWLFTLHAPSYRPFLTFADKRDLREQMWRAYNSRGNRGNSNDNNDITHRIVNLRLEKARLMDHPDYASYSLTHTMARDTQTVNHFLDSLLQASLPFAKKELDEVRLFAHEHGADYELQNWDFSYWAEKMKKERYDFDSEKLRPYFQLEKVRQGIFDLYHRLYGLTFVEDREVAVYHPDVKAYEVRDGKRFMGVLYLDMFPRESKRSGAWMTDFRAQSNIDGSEQRPLIQVVCNFTKPVEGKPSLLSFDEVETFMHEMGHAMHGMLSDITYPSVSGTNVLHDFVEMPSQVMENWCYEKEFLDTFAFHYQTGETLPELYIEKIRRSENYLAGWLCVRQLNFGMTDMAYHTLHEPLDEKIEAFEHRSMTELLPVIEGTCMSTGFTHIFSGGYAAGYYGYKWAEVLDADIFSRFKDNGIFDNATATAFRREILSKGGSEHPSVLFRNFMGRDPDNQALLRRCGFIPE